MTADLTARLDRFEAHLAELVHHIKDVRVSSRAIDEPLGTVEVRYGHIEQRIDRVERRLDTVENELHDVRAWQHQTEAYLKDEFAKMARRIDVSRDVVAKDYMRVRVELGELEDAQLLVRERVDGLEARIDQLEKKKP